MSGTQPTAPIPEPDQEGAVVTSIIAQATFILVLIGISLLAWKDRDPSIMLLTGTLYGIAATNATTIINFWVGSARGSQKKDNTIAAMATANQLPPAPPAAP